MLELAHAFAGGFIAYKTKSLIALPLSFLSHFMLDVLPHWNPNLHREKEQYNKVRSQTLILVMVDCLIGLFLGLFLAFKSLPSIKNSIIVILGCLFGIIPDLIEAPYYFLNYQSKFLKKIIDFQSKHQFNIHPLPGLSIQIIFVLILLYYSK